MTLDPQLAELIRCPSCRSRFLPQEESGADELVCTGCGLVYPIRNGVPVLLVDEAEPSARASTEHAAPAED